MGRALCKLCATKYLGKAFLCQCICVSSFCVQKPSAPDGFCARDFSLTIKAFWRAEQLRWVETNFKEMRKVDQCADGMKTVEKNLLRWHVRRDGPRWEDLRWGQKRWDEVRRVHIIWDEMKCGVRSANVNCEVRGVKSAVWSVKKVFAWRCIAPGSRAGHVLRQAPCNTKHARTGLAGARGMQIL